MVVDSILLHAESGPNDHRKDAPRLYIQLFESTTKSKLTILCNLHYGVRLWWLNIYFRFFINRRYLELIHVGSVSHLKCDTEIEIKFDFTFIHMTTIDDSSSMSHWSHGVIFELVGICCGHWSDSLMNWRICSLFLLYTAILKPDFDLKYFLFSWISFEKSSFEIV